MKTLLRGSLGFLVFFSFVFIIIQGPKNAARCGRAEEARLVQGQGEEPGAPRAPVCVPATSRSSSCSEPSCGQGATVSGFGQLASFASQYFPFFFFSVANQRESETIDTAG